MIESALATLREHAECGCVVLYGLDTDTKTVAPMPFWLNAPESDRPMLMEVANVLEKNPTAWG